MFQVIEIAGKCFVLCLLTGRWSREQPAKYAYGMAGMCRRMYTLGAHH
jgi:hypothetical protein